MFEAPIPDDKARMIEVIFNVPKGSLDVPMKFGTSIPSQTEQPKQRKVKVAIDPFSPNENLWEKAAVAVLTAVFGKDTQPESIVNVIGFVVDDANDHKGVINPAVVQRLIARFLSTSRQQQTLHL